MSEPGCPEVIDLLSLCAILAWFDRDLLAALGVRDDNATTALLAGDQVLPVCEPAGASCLRPELRDELLAQMRAERPLDELQLHTCAFTCFLRRMQAGGAAGARRADDEAACFYHLNKLFFLLGQSLRWQVIAGHVAAARAAHPTQPRNLHQLALYEGYIAVRTQQYEHGRAILRALIEQPGLAPDVQMGALNGLAQADQYQSQYDRALAWYQRLHASAQAAGDMGYQGVALLNMGMIYNDLDLSERALDLSMQSLQIFRALNDRREIYALHHVGNNAMQLGRWELAEEHFQEAIRLCEAQSLTAVLAALYWGQGFLQHLLGSADQSERAYKSALEIARSPQHADTSITMDSWFYLGLLYQTEGRCDEALAAYDQAVALAAQMRREHWISLIHYRRGNIFEIQGDLDRAEAAYRQSIEGIESLRAEIETEEIKIGLLGTSQQVYEAMVLLCLRRERPAEAFGYVERARSRAFLDALVKRSPELYAAVSQPVATLAEVQAHLPEGGLLVEYFTTGVLPRGEGLINRLPPENARLRQHLTLAPSILIFAITRDGFEVQRAKLDPNTLRPHTDDPVPGRRLLHERLLARLYDALVAPFGHLLPGRSLLYLIPHGPLHYVPFMALRAPHGAHLLAADGPAVALAPSATILLRSCLGRPAQRGAGLLALGYNDEGASALRYAEAEARHVAGLGGGEVWAGPEAKGARLIAEAQRVRWLHIAGHAIYDQRDPLESHLRLGAGDLLNARAIIAGLDLNADLVTLSACTSGLTQVVSGDELLGLQRALLYAGAPAVLCTLWEAYDFIALLVMDRFYTDLLRGRPAAVALRDAQVALRTMTGRDVAATIARWSAERPDMLAALGGLPEIPPEHYDTPLYADPVYWAPFMLIGRAG